MFVISSFMAHGFLDDFPSQHPHRRFIPRMTSKMFSKGVSSTTENVSKENAVDCLQFFPPQYHSILSKSLVLYLREPTKYSSFRN